MSCLVWSGRVGYRSLVGRRFGVGIWERWLWKRWLWKRRCRRSGSAAKHAGVLGRLLLQRGGNAGELGHGGSEERRRLGQRGRQRTGHPGQQHLAGFQVGEGTDLFGRERSAVEHLSLIHISEPTRRTPISY